MKKLMVMLSAIALAVCAQAASVDWQISYSGMGATWKGSDVTVLAFSGSDYANVIVEKVVDGVKTYEVKLDGATALSGSGADFITNLKGTAKTDIIQSENAPNSMFWVILADGSTEPGSAALWTDVTDVTGKQYAPPNQGTAIVVNKDMFGNSGTVAVPEPTSGLLLLVGAAGLALRRRRA